jgi:hypothetical protein
MVNQPSPWMSRIGVALSVGLVLVLVAIGADRVGGLGSVEVRPSPHPSQTLKQRSGGAGQIHSRWKSCFSQLSAQRDIAVPDALTLPSLDDAFRPVAAIVCGAGPRSRPDGGSDAVIFEDHVGGLTVLVAAVRLPDEPPLPEPSAEDELPVMCHLGDVGVPWLVLLDAQGRWVRPGIPRSACDGPRHEVTAALGDQHRTRVDVRVWYEIESAQAARERMQR